MTENHKALVNIDQKLNAEIQRKHHTSTPSLSHLENRIQELSRARREHIFRQDFLDRLKFQIDNNYKSGNLRSFLITRLKKMTLIEVQGGRHSTMWKFLKYLTVALENLSEPNENPIEFIEGYLRKSSFIDPLVPHIYGQTRNYSNGIDNEAANPVDKEKAKELIKKKLETLHSLPAPEAHR